MNPWKIIGWILLVLLLLMLTFCGVVCHKFSQTYEQSNSQGPSKQPISAKHEYAFQTVSVECTSPAGRDKADVTIRNVGNSEVQYAKVFVSFFNDGNVVSAQDSYLRPTSIPPGATASATVYSSGGGADSCAPTAFQDSDGNPIKIR